MKQDQVALLHFRPGLVPFCVESAELHDCVEKREAFRDFLELLHPQPSQEEEMV